MKKFLTVVLVSLIWGSKINAQDFRLGVHVTPSINYLSTSMPDAETDLTLKFGFGLMVDYYFSQHYAISTGVDILNSGSSLILRDTVGDFKAGYVNLPIALKMTTREFGYFTYFARFGGGLSIKTSERVDFDPDASPQNTLDSYINPFGLTFRFGGGAEYSFGGSTSLVAEITYNRSLIDNVKDESELLSEKHSYRFDYVSISLGVFF